MNFLNRWGERFSFLTEIDLRALSLFRITFGFLCIVDIFRRIPRLTLLYTNEGIWSNHMAIFSHDGFPPFSLLYSLSTVEEVSIFLVLYGICVFLFTVGYRTKIFQVLSLVGIISIYNRNQIVAYGGDSLIIVLHIITLFLPLSRTFSVDSYTGRNKVLIHRNKHGYPVIHSLMCAVIYIQLSILYFYSAWEKSGVTWLSGSAMHYFLHLDKSVTPFGIFLRGHLHPVTSLVLTWGALAIEWGAAFLIISPFATSACRRVAIYSLALLHVGIASVQSIAIFQLLMTTSLIFLLPSRDITFLSPHPTKRDKEEDSTIRKPISSYFREAAAMVIIPFILSLSVLHNSHAKNLFNVSMPPWISKFAYYIGFREAWGFFSPDVGIGDSKLVIDLKFRSGNRIDPQTGKEPSYEPLKPNEMEWDQLWHNYTEALTWRRNKFQVTELERWMASRRKGLHDVPQGETLDSYKAEIVSDLSPPPGSAWDEPPMIRNREVIISSKRD